MEWVLLGLLLISLYVAVVYTGMYYAVAVYQFQMTGSWGMYQKPSELKWRSYLMGWTLMSVGYVILQALFPAAEKISSISWMIVLLPGLVNIALLAWSLGTFVHSTEHIDLSQFHKELFRPLSDTDLLKGLQGEAYPHNAAWKIFLHWLFDIVITVAAGMVYPVVILLVHGPWLVLPVLAAMYFMYMGGRGIVLIIRRRMHNLTFH